MTGPDHKQKTTLPSFTLSDSVLTELTVMKEKKRTRLLLKVSILECGLRGGICLMRLDNVDFTH